MRERIGFFLFVLILLQGCQWGEPRVPLLNAKLSVVNGKVCISTDPEGDERVTFIIINEAVTRTRLLQKSELSLHVAEGACVPDFETVYELNKMYNVTIGLMSESKRRSGINPYGRIFSNTFMLKSVEGALEVAPVH